MTAYSKNTPGFPTSGFYIIGDTCTDSAGITYECVSAGYPGAWEAVAGFRSPSATPLRAQGTPAAKTTSTTLTAAELLTGLITGNQGAAGAATYTMPLGADIETALQALYPGALANDDSFDFTVINISTNAAETVTLATNTGLTMVGDLTIAAIAVGDASQGVFRVRRTGAGTFTVYRVA